MECSESNCIIKRQTSGPTILQDTDINKMDFTTTTRDHYKPPQSENIPRARRRDVMERFFWSEIAQEVFDEYEKTEEVDMKDCKSIYKDDFTVNGFVLKEPLDMVDTEMFSKYPLYTDMPQTIYWSKLDRIKGKAVSPNPMAAFRKASHFSKQWYDELE